MADEQVRVNLVVDGTDSATRAYEAFRRLNAEVDTIGTRGTRAGNEFNRGMQQVKSGGGVAAQGLMQVAYAADDLQYGFRAIVNNIPTILTGLGMGAGLAGAISILSVGVNQLYQHWDDLLGVFQAEGIRNAAADMHALADASAKVAASMPRSIDVGRSVATITAAGSVQGAIMSAPTPEAEALRRAAKLTVDMNAAGDAAKMVAAGRSESDPTTWLERIMGSYSAPGAVRATPAQLKERSQADKEAGVAKEFAAAMTDPIALKSAIATVRTALAQGTGSDEERAKLNDFLKALENLTASARAERAGKAFENAADNLVRGFSLATMKAQTDIAEKRDKENEKQAKENEKQAKLDADATKRRVDAQDRENADRLKSWQNSPEHQQAIASDAMQRYNEAEFAYATAGNPQMARMLRQQQAMARRFGGANTSASIMQRQMMERLGGGSEAIAQRERAQEVMREASMTFKEAVEKLAREGLQVTL